MPRVRKENQDAVYKAQQDEIARNKKKDRANDAAAERARQKEVLKRWKRDDPDIDKGRKPVEDW